MALRPTSDNRSDCLNFIFKQIEDDETALQKRYQYTLGVAKDAIESGELGSLAISLGALFSRVMMLAYCRYRAKDLAAASLVQQAFAYGYWAAEIDRHDFIAGGYGYDAPNSVLETLIILHGLALAGNATQVADWLGPYLFNFLAGGGPDTSSSLTADPDYRRFMELIFTAQVKAKWLDVPFSLDELDQFKPLVQAAIDSDESFRIALDNYCDLRLSQSFGYDTVNAPKRRSRERAGLMFTEFYDWWTLVPTELFSLQYAFNQATGKTLSLEADHPLLKNPAMQVPPLWPLYEDELTQRVQAMGREVFGSDWKPLTKVPLVA